MTRFTDDEAAGFLRPWDAAPPSLLGEGMEGAVYAVDDAVVAKVWFAKPAPEVRLMKCFYDALSSKTLSFIVPQIIEVREVGGHVVSTERRLDGSTLEAALTAGRFPREQAQRTFVDLLSELAHSGSCPEARDLSVMDEGSLPDFDLAGLAARRARRFAKVLAPAVEDFASLSAALVARIPEVDSGRRNVIHGDLVPSNLLVSDGPTVDAVLDWGFFSTEGDPVFEAAVAGAVFDMYGDDALDTEMAMYDLIIEALGYSRTDLLVYRAAYSLITANAYDPAGNDGHFAWCAAALNRPDVVAAIRG
jgi:aminoglycoside phosphotransferase (APT) family kinase protein